MSPSSVRTAYTPNRDRRCHRTDPPSRDVTIELRREADSGECTVLGGKRSHPGVNCSNPPSTIGGAPNTDEVFTCAPCTRGSSATRTR